MRRNSILGTYIPGFEGERVPIHGGPFEIFFLNLHDLQLMIVCRYFGQIDLSDADVGCIKALLLRDMVVKH